LKLRFELEIGSSTSANAGIKYAALRRKVWLNCPAAR